MSQHMYCVPYNSLCCRLNVLIGFVKKYLVEFVLLPRKLILIFKVSLCLTLFVLSNMAVVRECVIQY